MKTRVALLLSALASAALLAGPASAAGVFEGEFAPPVLGAPELSLMALHSGLPLAAMPVLATGFWGGGTGGGTTYTGTAPIVVTGSVISCTAATGSVAGCLSAADWTTFNGKLSGTASALTPAGGTFTVTGAVLVSGGLSSASAVGGPFFYDVNTATVRATPLAATGWTFNVPTGKGYFFQVNSVEVASVASDGAIKSASTKTAGSVTLNVDGTTNSDVTILSGAHCTISGQSAITGPGHSYPAATTLRVLNSVTNAGEVIDYLCF